MQTFVLDKIKNKKQKNKNRKQKTILALMCRVVVMSQKANENFTCKFEAFISS